MIAAKDLRIGNKVGLNLDKFPDNYFEVIEVAEKAMKLKQDTEIHYFDDYQLDPIPLTEEILIKAGWIWNKECKSFEQYPNGDSRMNLQFRDVSGSYTMFNYVLKATIAERIYYLHQLQNLYYVLTGGEELTINL